MQRPDTKDFFAPRREFAIADTITMHRRLLFIEPETVPYFATAIVAGAPVMLAGAASSQSGAAADLFNAQWRDPLAPKFHVPRPGDVSDTDFARVQRMVTQSQGGVLDFVYFTGHGTIPFPRHAACTLYMDTAVLGSEMIVHGPYIGYKPFTWIPYNGIGTTTKKVGPGEYRTDCDYLFSTDAVPGDSTEMYRAPHLSKNEWVMLCLPDIVGDDNMFRLSGTALDDAKWEVPYSQPGADLVLDMERPTGVSCTYALRREARDEQ